MLSGLFFGDVLSLLISMMRHASFDARPLCRRGSARCRFGRGGRAGLPGLWVLSRSASSASSGSAAGVVFAVDGRGGAAAVALPGLAAFFDGEGGDGERDGGIGPPEAEGCVEREAGEHSCGEVGAEQVLGAFAGGGARSQALADAVLGLAELGHDDDAGDREADPGPADVGCSPVTRTRIASCAM